MELDHWIEAIDWCGSIHWTRVQRSEYRRQHDIGERRYRCDSFGLFSRCQRLGFLQLTNETASNAVRYSLQ